MTGEAASRRPSRATVRRRLQQLILALTAASLLGCGAMVGGAFLNDRAINAHPGRSMAHVTGSTWLRTTVEYEDDQGVYHAPPSGLLYPTGLSKGQNIWVTYSKDNPELVKVEGRGWRLSIIPALSVVVVVLIVAGLLWAVVVRATRPVSRTDAPLAADGSGAEVTEG
ncbi:DUF3592 domain-containing protein [Corynebacterium uterequi]|uniref:DUF3592 domain-containing protein n=1 Tax=Corynebacterium uterequi TaxID=1072256 RepID=A0A0G3HGP5_9CORY|nr:DUF3592 domain-containing protein [Corynebacterium uterequi]AKK10302.1 hypothetical protein CUTER_01410 [Corynebacterium uterequi]